jgi:hypothetical protein
VYGVTGEHSDRTEWVFGARYAKSRAQEFVRELEAAAKEQGVWETGDNFEWDGAKHRLEGDGIKFYHYPVEVTP